MLMIPKPLRTLLGAALALLLTACQTPGSDPSLPDAARFAPIPAPVAPVGQAQCDDDGDGVFAPCLSQAQADRLFNDVISWACASNDKLAWLSDYYVATRLPPSCGAGLVPPD